MMTRLFWTLFAVEAAAYLILMIWTSRSTKWGPEGPVGAWIVFAAPVVMLGLPLGVVLIGKSERAVTFGVYSLALPLVQLALGPLYSAFQDFQTDRRLAGDYTFLRPAQRRLAHALRDRDAARVNSLIREAGDVNRDHRGESLFRFAITNVDGSDESAEIIRAMLAAGAKPDQPFSGGQWPLLFAISAGPKVTKLLLEAGADPNRIDDAGRPVWWQCIGYESDERIETLRLLLDHGADVTMRDQCNGPVGWAAHMKNWRAVWLLMERGAAWKDETSFGQPVARELALDLQSRQAGRTAIPDEMIKVLAMYGFEPRAR